MPMKHPTVAILALLLILPFTGCSKSEPVAPTSAHVHHAPHGGLLVELGEHAYNLELVRDPAAGRLTAYVLDAHAENFIRLKAPSFDAVVTIAREPHPVAFKAIANPATGETVGDTAQFEAEADWLKTTAPLDVSIASLEIRESRFPGVAFTVK